MASAKHQFIVFTPDDPVYSGHRVLVALKAHVARLLPDYHFIVFYETDLDFKKRSASNFMVFPMPDIEIGTGKDAGMISVTAQMAIPPSILAKIITVLHHFNPQRPARLN